MRVISGTAKGHRLFAPKSAKVRPAQGKVKESIFDILFDVEGRRVLDLFAGSGSIGIEALSRGALEAVFVEEWGRAAETIERNLEHCKLMDRAEIMKSTAAAGIKRLGRMGRLFDLVFVDPPYLKGLVNSTLELLAASRILAEDATIVVEHHPKEPIGSVRGLALTDNRKYGQTLITFLKKSP